MNTDFTRLHSAESEQCVIGALMLDPSAADRLGALRPDHCFSESHQIILAKIMKMIAAGKPIDVVTVAEELHARGLDEQTGGLAYLGELISATPSARNIGRYAEIIIGKALERQLLAASEIIRERVSGVGTTAEKLAASQAAVMGISESVASRSPRTMRDVLLSAAETLKQRSEGTIKGLPTGFIDLDKILSGGLRPGNIVVVAGRPAMGKTALSVNIAYQAAREGKTALILSMEMSEQELSDRLMAQAGLVSLSDVIDGKMDGDSGDRIMVATEKLYKIPLVIDDQGGLNLFDVVSKTRSVKRKHGLDLLVIDYLQLMDGDSGEKNRNNVLEQITRGLKALAKELQIPIILLSQLSRKCEERPNKRPMLSDLRDSGAIEQDADVVAFVYRDEVYNETSPDKGTAEIIIGKNRQGQTGMVRMVYQGCYTKFDTISPGWQPEHREQKTARRRGGDDY